MLSRILRRGNVNVVMLRKLTPKLKDLESFSIVVTTRNLIIDKALCELARCHCQYSTRYVKEVEDVSELTPTKMRLQFDDHSVVILRNVDGFYFKNR